MTPFDVDASPIAWREAGFGPVVVFLHGLGGSRTAWEPQLYELSDRFRCVAWDMPGYGASEPFEGPMTWESASSAVIRLLDLLAAEQVHMVGMSLGGMVALHVALRHQPRLRSLVLVSSSPAFGLDGATTAEEWRKQRLAPLATGATLGELAAVMLPAIAGPHASQEAIAAAAAAMARVTPAGYRAAVECLPTHDVRTQLAEITVPVLVLVGELDTETPPSYSEFLVNGLPRGRLEVVAGTGHLLNLEAPAVVNGSLRRFLEDQET